MSMLSFYKVLLQLLNNCYEQMMYALKKNNEKVVSNKNNMNTAIILMKKDEKNNGNPGVEMSFHKVGETAALADLRNITDGLAKKLAMADEKIEILDEKNAKLVKTVADLKMGNYPKANMRDIEQDMPWEELAVKEEAQVGDVADTAYNKKLNRPKAPQNVRK